MRGKWNEVFIAVILFANYVYFLPRWADWSQNSRLDLTLAIVDKGTLSIEDYYKNTGDYALFEGRHYLDKAPGPSLLAVPIYFIIKPILLSYPINQLINKIAESPSFQSTLKEGGSGLLSDKVYFQIVLYIITLILASIPTVITGILLFRFLNAIGCTNLWSTSIVLIYGLATNAFTYAGGFYSHQLCAVFLFSSFYIGFLIRKGLILINPRIWLFFAGLMLGFSLISEYPTFLMAFVIFIYIIFVISKIHKFSWFPFLILGGLIPGILLMGYNFAIFHTLLPVGYEYSALYQEQHSVGLISLTYPHIDALWGITFGSFRGLFYVSPITILALCGILIGWKHKPFLLEWAVCASNVISFFIFNSSSVMWQGGFSVGPRYLVPMLPFLMVGLGFLSILIIKQKLFIWLAFLLAIWSAIIIWIETISGQSYPDWTQVPLINYSLPRLLANDIARNLGMIVGLHGWVSLLPLFIFMIVLSIGFILLDKRTKSIRILKSYEK
jgi:hypothetical protein